MEVKLKECRDCQKLLSPSAKICINCGLPNPTRPLTLFERLKKYEGENKSKSFTNVVIVLVFLVILGAIIPDSPSETKTQLSQTETQNVVPKTPEEIDSERLSSWYGARTHWQLYSLVKENLKDPDSLELIKTSYERKKDKKGNYVKVNMKYRAKNGFGGYNVESISADCDLDGNILKIN